jgi:hypothetical protein
VHSPQPTSPVLKEDEEMGRENAGDGEGNNELREEVREEVIFLGALKLFISACLILGSG